ncbi:MAG: chromosomal replication initiator protein DnaA, partial [bacterium]|nr:chromosomal replication initiator protein DnaA [bacterium]
VVAAPSTMVIDLLNKRFDGLIKKTLDKHMGKDMKVSIIPKSITKSEKQEEKIGPLFIEEEKAKTIGHLPRVRSEYTFQNMAVSSSNQLAFISAQTVAKKLGNSYNPLFIYGPVGVGKTHLMQAIANEVYQKDSSKKIIYITSEEFTNEVVEAIRTNDTSKMKKKFRTISLLIIDDIQFIAGKDRVQEELFHTFNILIDNGAQIVLSSDRPPEEIKKLEKRLSSRFAGGLSVDIESPDFELRTAVLLIKAKKYDIDLPIESAKIIAEKNVDCRSLEGTLLKIITYAKTNDLQITPELVEKTLGEREEKTNVIHPDDIIKNVCQFYNIKPTQLKGPKRDASLVKARQITMYVLKNELRLTLVEIGSFLGGRDHTTIMHGITKIENMLSTNPKMASEILGIKNFLS